MIKDMNRTRWSMAATLAAVFLVAGCDRIKTELLAPQNPGIVDPSAVSNPSAALALRVGAIGRYKQVNTGESIWEMGGTLADEYKNADFEATRISADQRLTDPATHNWNYGPVTQSRGYVRDAIASMKAFTPDSSSLIGEMYMELAFFEMTMADNYCNGIPLGHTVNGVQTNGAPLTIAQVYDSANAHLDTAIAMSSGGDAGSVYINRAARIFKARVLIDKDKANAPAAAALVASIPTSYQYLITYSPNDRANGMWVLNNSVARISVADSFDATGTIKNALPFASAQDPRVPVVNGSVATPVVNPEDAITKPFYVSLLYKGQYDPSVLASGIDARMYEAEAKLQGSDIAGMLTILNAARAASPTIGVVKIPVMAPIAATPPDANSATSLLFREKAFWTFGRGQRLPDLRRLVRQYGRTQDNVFPTGTYFKGGTYGADVNYPIPSQEQVNPLFNACIDRKA